MAELTTLEEKLAEVLGQAAKGAAEKVDVKGGALKLAGEIDPNQES